MLTNRDEALGSGMTIKEPFEARSFCHVSPSVRVGRFTVSKEPENELASNKLKTIPDAKSELAPAYKIFRVPP